MTTPQFQSGMAVVATDGLLGSVDALQAQLRSPAEKSQDLIVRGSDGILRLVPPRWSSASSTTGSISLSQSRLCPSWNSR